MEKSETMEKLGWCAAPHITREYRTMTVGETEAKHIVSVIATAQRRIERLEGALRSIRDSTFRNAMTLRGMADAALQEPTE